MARSHKRKLMHKSSVSGRVLSKARTILSINPPLIKFNPTPLLPLNVKTCSIAVEEG
jgi:hypothetical protein